MKNNMICNNLDVNKIGLCSVKLASKKKLFTRKKVIVTK